MIREVEKRRLGAPLLTLKEQGHQRPEQHDRSGDFQRILTEQLAAALAVRAIADLIVVLEETDEPRTRQVADWTPVFPLAEGR